jgi:hypothetical protein
MFDAYALNGLNGYWGYFDMLPNVSTVGGQEYDALVSLLVPAGDANLDGTVDYADFQTLAANYGQSGADWEQGDFNDDGIVNSQDLNILRQNIDPAGFTLQQFANQAPAAPHDMLALTTASTTETAGQSFNLTVTAQQPGGGTDTGYVGTVHFTSSDVQAGLPADFTFAASDDGTYTFAVTLKTAGSQSITATDTATPAINGTLSGISVSPAAASQLVLSGLSSTATAGAALNFTVTAEDPYGNVATDYTGTVQFTSSDTAASLPANYTFTNANQGVQTFTLTFETPGTQSVTVTDTSSGITATQS